MFTVMHAETKSTMTKMIGVVVVLLMCVSQASMTCTELSESLSCSVFQKLRLLGSTYLVVSSRTQFHCAMQCMYDVMCASFNYDTATSSCELNYETSTTTPGQVVSPPGWINANAESFPQSLIGLCAHHTCLRGSVCTYGSPLSECVERHRCVAGTLYRGSHNITKLGRTCQRWDAVIPHGQINMYDSTISSMEEAGNRCLTESNDTTPWCYTTDPMVPWEYCSIPQC